MSEENVEIVRALFPGTMDMAAVFADPATLSATRSQLEPWFHADFETVADPKMMPVGNLPGEVDEKSLSWTVRGIDGFVSAWTDFLTDWEAWVVEPTEFIDLDEDRVFVLIEIRGRSKTQQVEMTVESGNVVTLRDGKVARLQLFFERRAALEAAGLSE
jgi:hypothetical protein